MSAVLRNCLAVFLLLAVSSCKKDYPTGENIRIRIAHEVDGDPLQLDTLLYVADAGYAYRVSGLRYFLSDITLVGSDGSRATLQGTRLVDFANSATTSFDAGTVPEGTYTGIEFEIGVPDAENVSGGIGGLAAAAMGGLTAPFGYYRFLHFTGSFLNADSLQPFSLVVAGMSRNIHYRLERNITVVEGGASINMVMNLSEWLRLPYDYDFLADGPNTLSDTVSMNKLFLNGVDVFRFR
ncbi:MAG: MbnP family protein [Bacteroidota bacterium]